LGGRQEGKDDEELVNQDPFGGIKVKWENKGILPLLIVSSASLPPCFLLGWTSDNAGVLIRQPPHLGPSQRYKARGAKSSSDLELAFLTANEVAAFPLAEVILAIPADLGV